MLTRITLAGFVCTVHVHVNVNLCHCTGEQVFTSRQRTRFRHSVCYCHIWSRVPGLMAGNLGYSTNVNLIWWCIAGEAVVESRYEERRFHGWQESRQLVQHCNRTRFRRTTVNTIARTQKTLLNTEKLCYIKYM